VRAARSVRAVRYPSCPLPMASEPASFGSYLRHAIAVDIGDDRASRRWIGNDRARNRRGAFGPPFGACGAQLGVVRLAPLAHVVERAAHLAIGEGHQEPAHDREVLER